jgi:hypothetical protein
MSLDENFAFFCSFKMPTKILHQTLNNSRDLKTLVRIDKITRREINVPIHSCYFRANKKINLTRLYFKTIFVVFNKLNNAS